MPDFLTISRDLPQQLEPTAEWLNLVAAMKDTPPAERKRMLIRFMLEQARLLQGADALEALDPRTPLDELGLDSMMAVKLASRLGSAAGVSLSVTLLFNYPTIDEIADYFLREVIVLEQGDKAGDHRFSRKGNRSDAVESVLDAIEQLSDQEVYRLSTPLEHVPEEV